MLDPHPGMITGNHLNSGDPYHITNGYCSNSLRRSDFGSRSPTKPRNYYNSGDLCAIEFESNAHMEDDSGISSPPLWKTSPTKDSFPFLHYYHGRHIAPTLRSAEIERGRQELMEMMRDLPESAYELSLKDIVEMPMAGLRKEQRSLQEESEIKIKKKKDRRRGSLENGAFLLKMIFPSFLGSKKRSSKGSGTGSRVSPRPLSPEGIDEEWWKRNEQSETSRSSSNTTNSNQRNNGSRNMSGFIPGCWSFFHT